MTEWDDALRAAYHEGFGGTFTRKKASEHMVDAFGHLSRCVLRAVDAAFAQDRQATLEEVRAAALVAFKEEVFDQWIQANLPAADYIAIQRRAADVRAFRAAQNPREGA